jgi:hypothetical protein
MNTVINKSDILTNISGKVKDPIDSLIYEAINRDDGINYKGLMRPVANVFYCAFQDYIYSILDTVDEDNEVTIKLFDGLYLHAKMLPPEKRRNNLTGKTIITKRKIKITMTATRYYKESLMKGRKDEFPDL